MRNPESMNCSVGGDTMKRRMDVLVKCPYYKGDEKQKIVCEGVQDGAAMHLALIRRTICGSTKTNSARSRISAAYGAEC